MTVLVTGAIGLVGSATVKRLVDDGRPVVATDLDVPANRKAAEKLTGAEVRRADLTDPAAFRPGVERGRLRSPQPRRRRGPAGPQGQSAAQRRLVRHRLDGHSGPGSPWLSTSFVAGHAHRYRRARRLEGSTA